MRFGPLFLGVVGPILPLGRGAMLCGVAAKGQVCTRTKHRHIARKVELVIVLPPPPLVDMASCMEGENQVIRGSKLLVELNGWIMYMCKVQPS